MKVRKQFILLLFAIALLFSFPQFAYANKCGVNIGPHYSQINKAKELTGTGGWIVALGTPGNCKNFSNLFDQGLNVVIRAYNGGQAFTNKQALGWTATLGELAKTTSQKIYFMPWNEPNHGAEGGGSGAGDKVYQYVQFLKNQLSAAGLLDNKVILLSPMVDKLNPSFINNSFFTNLGGKSAFYKIAHGSTINEYDLFSPDPCTAEAAQNNCQYDQINIPAPYYALEAGVAGTCNPPCYKDDEIALMLNTSWNQKWQTDNNLRMFAVFSYDPHRPGRWDIFSSSQTKNFYQSHCSSGAVNIGNFDEVKFDQWFNTQRQQLIQCDECGWAPEKYCASTDANPINTEPEKLYLKDSLISTNFNIKYEKKNTFNSLIPIPLGESFSEEIIKYRGQLKTIEKNLPDLQQAQETLASALEKLYPANLKPYVETSGINSGGKHYVYGLDKDENGNTVRVIIPENERETLKEKSIFAKWWGKLIGESKLYCSIYNTCPAVKTGWVQIIANDVYFPGEHTRNEGEKNIIESVSLENDIENPYFTIRSSFSKKSTTTAEKTISDLGEELFNWITKKETTSAFENETRSILPGGGTLANETSFPAIFLPAEEVLGEKDSPLLVKSSFEAKSDNPNEKLIIEGAGSEELKYHQLAKFHKTYCLSLCSQYPASIDIKEIDPVCPSCNPNDYKITGYGDSPLSREICQRRGDGGCDYFDPEANQGCGPNEDSLCEGGKCNPYEISLDSDYYDQCGGLTHLIFGEPYSTCVDPSVCYEINLAPNPSGGFGECQYANPDVCVRIDRIALGKCAAICNWGCCAWQDKD